MCVCVYVCIHIYVCMCVCVYIGMYVYMCIYICVYTDINIPTHYSHSFQVLDNSFK